ncbi:TfoX/Sxy family protein [Halosquirtibacter laminarini]|uniref:TfoX/Sxy family protein n=1 Tax=Halosquirtibacter laminarini TaxID=3374600 RepID=A0AC61NJ62_9BACT|nr:TfoX/Sxy family protein [Prolixibacteraceae bacterium]
MKKDSLSLLPNIGPQLAKLLCDHGIHSEHDLKSIGSYKAWERISLQQETFCCIQKLYALEGAIQGVRWHNLSDKDKQQLKQAFELFKQNKKLATLPTK